MSFQEMSREQFIANLVERGWSRAEAEAEWEAIQNDDESGYDGA
jgi:hypothetical protein